MAGGILRAAVRACSHIGSLEREKPGEQAFAGLYRVRGAILAADDDPTVLATSAV
jgi:hypothetical protein